MLHNHVCIVPFTKYFWNTETLTLEVITRHYKIQVTIDHLYSWKCQLILTYYDSACWETRMSNKCGVFCTISVWLKRRIAWGKKYSGYCYWYITHFQLLTKHSLSDFKTSPNTCMNLWLSLYPNMDIDDQLSYVLMNLKCTQNYINQPNQQKCKNTVLILLAIGKHYFHPYIQYIIWNMLLD